MIKKPIVGVGGVTTWEDAVELMLAGATAIQIGSALGESRVGVFKELSEALNAYLKKRRLGLAELIGSAHRR